MTEQRNGNGAPPVANRAVVTGMLKRALHRAASPNTVLLLRAAPQWHDSETFGVELGEKKVTVTVKACATVLAILDALAGHHEDSGYLVILTSRETDELGDTVFARAIEREVVPVDRWDLVQDALGTRLLDPQLPRTYTWLPGALLEAQPAGGWRKVNGPVLTLDAAMSRLAAARLGQPAEGEEIRVDAAALLQWTTDPPAVASFNCIWETERRGIIDWFRQTIPGVAEAVFAISPAERITDAVPLGLAISILYGDKDRDADPPVARIRAEERFFAGNAPVPDAMRAFGEAAESLITRWTSSGSESPANKVRERAESILRELQADEFASQSEVLDAGFDARLGVLARALTTRSVTDAQTALDDVVRHRQARARSAERAEAHAAVRVLRWLATPEDVPPTLADAATLMLRSWSWADRALHTIERPSAGRVPALAEAYRSLVAAARQRRARMDEVFARKLAAWTLASSQTSDLLLVENLLDRVARPLAERRLPLIVVLDGMSASVAAEIADQPRIRSGWTEAGRREDGREPVLATVPSVTSISRTSLLCGVLRTGAQAEEEKGFAAFWGRRKSRLFHKGDLAPSPGDVLAADLRDAIADTDLVVAVVLNAIDDALDKGKQGHVGWLDTQVTHLIPVLDAARRAGRPVILTADHGHVLDRGEPIAGAASDSARYRVGESGSGEITITGPRVLVGGGTVVAAVDEGAHYTPRKAGYHGGASAAEVVVPAIVLLPSASLKPSGWHEYDPDGHAPLWWDAIQTNAPAPAVTAAPAQSRRKNAPSAAMDALFAEPAFNDESLGSRVVASSRFADQRTLARRAPADAQISALIDALAAAGGKLTVTEVAAVTGEPAVRMRGYITTVSRLLNVDGYRVITLTDGNRTVDLNTKLLTEQFLGS